MPRERWAWVAMALGFGLLWFSSQSLYYGIVSGGWPKADATITYSTADAGQERSLAAILSILVSAVSLRAVRSMPLLGGVERREQLDLAELGAPCRRPGSLAQKRPLLKPLFQISGEVFKPTQGSHIDLHMLAMVFHDRQIEENLVERVRTIHIGDSHHTTRAHTFPEVDHHARLLCAQTCFGFAGPNREEILLRHGCRILEVEINVIQHLVFLLWQNCFG
jgi:hypothetical protein